MEKMDMLRAMKDMKDKISKDGMPQDAPDDFQMPSMDKLLEMIEQLDMSSGEKDELRKSIENPQMFADKMGGFGQPPYSQSYNIFVVCGCVLVMLILFAFFGYKLYRSLTEKERKREEKKKQKQQKKKHK